MVEKSCGNKIPIDYYGDNKRLAMYYDGLKAGLAHTNQLCTISNANTKKINIGSGDKYINLECIINYTSLIFTYNNYYPHKTHSSL